PSGLLRKAARLADRLHAPWYAVYIQTPQEDLTKIDAATQRRVDDTLTLAQQLGAVIWSYKGADVVASIATFAREYAITYVVLGRSRRPWYRRWFGQSVLDRLLQTLAGVDVVV